MRDFWNRLRKVNKPKETEEVWPQDLSPKGFSAEDQKRLEFLLFDEAPRLRKARSTFKGKDAKTFNTLNDQIKAVSKEIDDLRDKKAGRDKK